jgi:hypothetical protein
VKSDSLARRFADCSELQCGHACIFVYPTTDCNSLGPDFNLTNAIVWDTIIIEDTAGVTKPFYSAQDPFSIQVRSLEYVTPTKGGDECPYIQFSFNAQNQSTGWTYIRPGQTDVPCVTFANATVTGYNGVTMLTDVPANLLEWADNDGNVAYEGFTEDDTF